MNGYIHVQSQVDQGTTFSVLLPVHESQTDTKPDLETASGAQDTGSEAKILVVDDEPQVAAVVVDMLEELGYQSTSFTSSAEAVKEISESPDKYSLIITDQMMPVMSGLEMTEQIHNIQPELPVILISGFSNLLVEEELNTRGITEYLRKPILFNELQESVHRMMKTIEV
jgi:CheY-like chemotaxis protein